MPTIVLTGHIDNVEFTYRVPVSEAVAEQWNTGHAREMGLRELFETAQPGLNPAVRMPWPIPDDGYPTSDLTVQRIYQIHAYLE